MNFTSILIAVAVVAGIGLIIGLVLAVASVLLLYLKTKKPKLCSSFCLAPTVVPADTQAVKVTQKHCQRVTQNQVFALLVAKIVPKLYHHFWV